MEKGRIGNYRKSIRLKEYDYSQEGAYFVTICAWKWECFFGDVINGEMELNKYGRIIEGEWLQTGNLRSNVEIDEYVVMPNHFHGILIINENNHSDVGARRCLAQNVHAEQHQGNGNNYSDVVARRCLAPYNANDNNHNRVTKRNRATQRVAPTTLQSNSLGSIVGQFKSIVTKQINKSRNTPGFPVWQRNYYDHIVRNENELNRIREYIIYNPMKWQFDRENPDHIEDKDYDKKWDQIENMVYGKRTLQ